MPKYTNQTQIENVLQRQLITAEIDLLDDLIETVSQLIDDYTGRQWFDIGDDGSDAEEETRLFDGNGRRELFVDDFTSLSRVRFFDSLGQPLETLGDSFYVTRPANTPWKNSVLLRDRSFPNVRSGVELTGVFYTGTVPIEVQLAAANLVGNYVATAKNVGDYKKESIEGYSYEILTGEEKTSQEMAVFSRIEQWRKVAL